MIRRFIARRRQAHSRDERGAAAIFVLSLSLVLLLCTGLVVDGGVAINARMRVADDAEQAARVGADSINVQALRDGQGITVDRGLASSRAADYLAARGYGGGQYEVNVLNNGTVEVDVRDTTETILLGLVGIGQYNVGAGASAEPLTEVAGEQVAGEEGAGGP